MAVGDNNPANSSTLLFIQSGCHNNLELFSLKVLALSDRKWQQGHQLKNNYSSSCGFPADYIAKPGLLRSDGLHPSWRGALILSTNIDRALTPLAPQ